MLIQLRDACRIYEKGGNEIRALDGVSLDIREGEFVSIMGPSGSGKSTLMHLLGCLDRPTGGSYVLDGVRVEGLNDAQLSRIRNSKVGFVFQTFNLLSDLSTVENVGLPLVYAGVDGVDRRERCANAASAIGLGRRLLHKPTELSGGEVQRVAIARALVNHPKIILADEPTGNLDSRTGQEIMAIFAKLHESGKTVIMVTHDERLARYANRVISLRDGKMVGEEKVESRNRSTFPEPDLKLQEPSTAASPREMSWRDLVRIGLREGLMAHKMRTALTMLGVLFGMSALIAMSSIGEGARREAIEQIRQMGSNNIRVRDLHLTGEELKEARRKLSDGLTLDDAAALKQIIPSVQDIAPLKELKVALRLGEKKPKGKVVATVPEYEKVANFHVERGRFITPADMDACARVCVLGKSLKKELFANEEAIGEEIRLGQDRYTVVGVMEGKDIPKGRMKAISTRDLNHDVYIPLTAGLKRVKKDKEDSELDEIALMVTDAEKVRPTAEVIQTVLDRRHHAVADYEMVVPEELLRQSQQTQRIFNIVMGCIAGISLLVGGIGIMNIMLATVTERTKEIGIRRAVGACERDILRQFLVEAVAISIIGGVVGIALGWAIGRVIALYAKWTTVVSPQAVTLGFGVSVAVGILFGIYPAWKAARQDPIQALRYE